MALVGMGGAGKTVLASKAAHDRRVQRTFPDGVVWLEVNQQRDIVTLQTRLARLLGDPTPQFTNSRDGEDTLAQLLADRYVLLILDNVWDREVLDAFTGLASGCRVLFTSRFSQLARDLGAINLEISALTLDQALMLLARWTDQEVDQLPPVADRICQLVDYLALGVAMVGAMLAQPGRTWRDLVDLLEQADLAGIKADFGKDYPHKNLLAAIQLSIDDLANEAQERYRELAVFTGQGVFPRTAVEALWAPAGVTGPAVGDLLAAFVGRSLMSDEGDGWFGVHDLQLEVISKQLGQIRLYNAHQRLLDGYQRRCVAGWPTGPNDGYFLEHLAVHLARADRHAELRGLLTSLEWMRAKLTATGLAALLADYPHDPDTPASQAVRLALQLSAGVITSDPDQLPGQLVGRLTSHPAPTVRAVAESISGWNGTPWLCPLTPPGLAAAAGPQRNILHGHADAVRAVAVSPDGHWIITGGDDKTVRLWNRATGQLVRTLTGHTGHVAAVAVSPDSQLIVSAGGSDKTVRVWNVVSGRLVRTLEGHTGPVETVAVTPDGQWIISAGDDKTVRVWELARAPVRYRWSVRVLRAFRDLWPFRKPGAREPHVFPQGVKSGQVARILPGNTDAVAAIAVSPDGQWIVTAGAGVQVWELASGRLVRRLTGHTGPVAGVAVSPDGQWIVTAGRDDETVRVWAASGRLDRTLKSHTSEVYANNFVYAVAVSPDGRWIVSGDRDGTVLMWELASSQPGRTFKGHSGEVYAVAVSPDSQQIISGSGDGTVRVWALANDQPDHIGEGHPSEVLAVAVSPDGQWIVSGHHDGMVRVQELASGRLVHTLKGHHWEVWGVAVSPDGKWVVSTGRGGGGVWELASGDRVGRTSDARAVAVSPDSRWIVSGYRDPNGEVSVHALARDERGGPTLEDHKVGVEALVVSPDGLVIAAGRSTIWAWELTSGQLVRTVFDDQAGELMAVAVSPDSRWIVSGHYDQSVRVWELGSGRLARTLTGHTGPVETVAVTPDGQWIISAGDDKTVRVWELASGRELTRWTSDHPIRRCAMSPARPLTIAVGDSSGMVYALELRGLSSTSSPLSS